MSDSKTDEEITRNSGFILTVVAKGVADSLLLTEKVSPQATDEEITCIYLRAPRGKIVALFFFATGCAFLYLKEKHQKKQTTLRVDRIVSRLQMIICSDVCSPPKTSPHRGFGF